MGEEEGVRKLQVQELAEIGAEPPARYVVREEDRPIGDPPLDSAVPIVDLSRLSRSDGGDEAAKLRSALQSWGLFQVIGHEMSNSFLDEVREVTRMFFRLPMEMKQKYGNLPEGEGFRVEGYGNDRATENQILSWADRLFLLVQPEEERKLEVWPENPSHFRDILHEFTMKTRKVVDCVLCAMAMVLELNENYFLDNIGERIEVYARFNYYPSCSRPDLVLGLQSHSDNSIMTIILLDKEVEGLQVLKEGEWVKVPIIPHALFINLGDLMEIMSNGVFKSPVHRVVTNSVKERISLAMFYHPRPETIIEPVEGLVDDTRPRLYKKVTTKDYVDAHFKNFVQGKRGIDWAKVYS